MFGWLRNRLGRPTVAGMVITKRGEILWTVRLPDGTVEEWPMGRQIGPWGDADDPEGFRFVAPRVLEYYARKGAGRA